MLFALFVLLQVMKNWKTSTSSGIGMRSHPPQYTLLYPLNPPHSLFLFSFFPSSLFFLSFHFSLFFSSFLRAPYPSLSFLSFPPTLLFFCVHIFVCACACIWPLFPRVVTRIRFMCVGQWWHQVYKKMNYKYALDKKTNKLKQMWNI